MIERVFKYNTRTCILFLLISLLAFFAGDGLFKVMTERTLGSIFRHNLMTIAVLSLLFAFLNENFISGIFNFRNIELGSKNQIILSIFIAFLLGIMIFSFDFLDTIYWVIILFIMFCVVMSIFYIFSEKSFCAFCLFWCVYPFIYYIQSEVTKYGFNKFVFQDLFIPFISIYILMLFFALILANLKKRNFFSNKNLRFAYWLILLSIPFLFFSDNPLKSFIFFVFDMLIPIVYFIFMISVIKDQKQIEIAIQFLLFSLIVFIFLTLYFYARQGGKELLFKLYEARTAIIAPITLANLSAIMLPFSFLLFKLRNNKIYFLLSSLLIIFIVLTNSRSALVSVFIAIAIAFILSRTKTTEKIYMLVFVFSCLFLLVFLFSNVDIFVRIKHRIVETISEIKEGASLDQISSGRIEIWESAIRMLKDHPIKGIGAGMWQDYAFLYKSKMYLDYYPGYGYFSYYSMDAHNLFLDLYLNYGILAFLLFLCLIFYILWQCYILYIQEAVYGAKKLITGIYISLLVSIFISNLDYRFYDYNLGDLLRGIFFWSVVGLVFKSVEIQKAARRRTLSSLS